EVREVGQAFSLSLLRQARCLAYFAVKSERAPGVVRRVRDLHSRPERTMPSSVADPTRQGARERAEWSVLTAAVWALAGAICAAGVWGIGLLVCRAIEGSDISETPEKLVPETALLLAGGGAVGGLVIGALASLLVERTALAALAWGLGAGLATALGGAASA